MKSKLDSRKINIGLNSEKTHYHTTNLRDFSFLTKITTSHVIPYVCEIQCNE
jgi:hypothetical protein